MPLTGLFLLAAKAGGACLAQAWQGVAFIALLAACLLLALLLKHAR
jgi:hypothetical protein